MANQEHLDILKRGVEVWNQGRQEHPDIQPDLSITDLNWANLSGANLRGVNLSGTNLKEASFIDTDLSEADLSGVDLSWANLGQAKIQLTIFGNVDLSLTKGLDTVTHRGPSTIGIDTIYRSRGAIVNATPMTPHTSSHSLKPLHAIISQPHVQQGLLRLAEGIRRQIAAGEIEEGGFAVE